MNGFWLPVVSWFSRFFTAWGNALIASVPERVGSALRLTAVPSRIFIDDLDKVREINPDNLSGLIDIEVCQDLVLAHIFSFPYAARGDVANAVNLEVERILPLEKQEFCIAHQIGGRVANDSIEVHVLAIRQSVFDVLLRWADSVGRVVHKISLRESHDGLPIVLPVRSVSVRNTMRHTFFIGLVAVHIFILGQIPAMYQDRLQGAVEQTDQKILASRQKTAAIANLQRQAQSMEGLAAAIEQERRSSRLLDVLVQLTKASPDEVYIRELRLDGRRLAVSGSARSPENWVVSLQQSEAFQDVTLTSVVGGGDDGTRQFELKMDAVWPFERVGNNE